MSSSTIIIADPFYKQHLTGAGHPECPARFDAIMSALAPLNLTVLKPREASEDEVLLCHTKNYYDTIIRDIDFIKKAGIIDGSITLSTGDVQISPDSLKAALKAAGGVLVAADAVCSGQAKKAFCVVRPPGHHACSNQGMGFCIFNNAAIAAQYCKKKYGLSKVLIADWDVHHGNGTQEIFYNDPTVFYFSTHQWPMYPGTGSTDEKGAGNILNFPISAGSNSRHEVLDAFKNSLIPAMEKFKPELVIISAGFDAHYSDPLGGFNLTEEDFADLTDIVNFIAEKHANGKIISVLEGGYNLRGIAVSAKAHVESLLY